MEFFVVGLNMLYGSIPNDIGSKFLKFEALNLDSNHFTRTIPSSISNISFLNYLDLGNNRFSGYIPPTLGKLGALQIVDLAYSNLETNENKGWEFITLLANCTQLRRLQLGGDSFGGKLPASVVNLSRTPQYLFIADNRVYGSIPVAC